MFRLIRQLIQKLKKDTKVETQHPSSHNNGKPHVVRSPKSAKKWMATMTYDAPKNQSVLKHSFLQEMYSLNRSKRPFLCRVCQLFQGKDKPMC